MKTRITTLIAAAVFTVSFSARATETKPSKQGPALISTIQASGNVEIFITQGDTEGVKVMGKYNEDNALIAAEDGGLKVASYSKETLTVLVTVTSLEGIEADGDARIFSTNRLDAARLEVRLNDASSAVLDADESSLKQDISDSATLVLSGREKNS